MINAKINMKRLEFDQSKCVKLHISKENRKQCTVDGDVNMRCVLLEVQEKEMKSGENEKYVGDIIASNGSKKKKSCNGSNFPNIWDSELNQSWLSLH